jgi:hypothetical protein
MTLMIFCVVTKFQFPKGTENTGLFIYLCVFFCHWAYFKIHACVQLEYFTGDKRNTLSARLQMRLCMRARVLKIRASSQRLAPKPGAHSVAL